MCNYTFDPEQLRKDLAYMIIVHEYPLSMVEHLGFIIYFEGLQPLLKIPSRNTINSDIVKIYEYEKVNIMGYLESIGSRIALTTNLWIVGNQKKWYMTITGHLIDDNWELQSRILWYEFSYYF